MLYNLHFFLSSKCRLFPNATLFDFCINHILNTVCAKIWKKKSVAKRLKAESAFDCSLAQVSFEARRVVLNNKMAQSKSRASGKMRKFDEA